MQDRTLSASSQPLPSSPLPGEVAISTLPADTEASPASFQSPPLPEPALLDHSLTTLNEILDEHKGKLAISAAAMLGLLIYYKWGERSLAKEDREEYERLRRIKEGVRQAGYGKRAEDKHHMVAPDPNKG